MRIKRYISKIKIREDLNPRLTYTSKCVGRRRIVKISKGYSIRIVVPMDISKYENTYTIYYIRYTIYNTYTAVYGILYSIYIYGICVV